MNGGAAPFFSPFLQAAKKLVPPRLAERMNRILWRFRLEILHYRVSVVHEMRSDGGRYWRLYIEAGRLHPDNAGGSMSAARADRN